MSEFAIVVDEDDSIISYKERHMLNNRHDRWRNTAVLLTNNSGDVLIARRHSSKKSHPNKWATSVSGTVEKGETYEANAYKELFEELGVTDVTLQYLGAHKIDFGNQKRFCGVFTGQCNVQIKKFVLQNSEVSAVRWIQRALLMSEMKKRPNEFAPGFENILRITNTQ